MKSEYRLGLVAFFLFIFLSLFITYPLILNLGTLTTGYGDELVIAWIQNWVMHSLSTGSITTLFNAPTFYPYSNTFAFSDPFITSSLLAYVPLQFIKEPIAAVNFTFISSLLLLGFSIYLLSFYITRDFLASLLSGILVMFSPAVLDKATHLQMLAIYWVPLSLLFFIHFLKTNRTRYLCISLFCFLLQAYNSFLPAYFIIVSFVVILFVYFVNDRRNLYKVLTKKNIFINICAFLLLIPVILPYYQVSHQFNYVRDIRDTIHFALQPEDLTYPSSYTRLQDQLLSLSWNKVSQNDEFKPGYVGLIFSFLIILASIYCLLHFSSIGKIGKSLYLISFGGLLLSFGPVLHLFRQTIHDPFPIPLPYAVLYYIAPGFQGFRNSARWEMLFILCIAVIIAIVCSQYLKNRRFIIQFFVYSLLIVGCIVEFNFPIPYKQVPSIKNAPAVYQWLDSTPKDSSVIFLPIYNWNMWPNTQRELWRQYYGTLHFKRMVNGYSGFSPPPWQASIQFLTDKFPNAIAITYLKQQGIDYVVIDTKAYGEQGLQEINDELYKNKSLYKVAVFKDYTVYKLEN